MEDLMKNIINIATTSGGHILLAIVVAVVGLLLIKFLVKLANRYLSKSKLDPQAVRIILLVAKIVLYLVLLIAVIEILGVPMTSITALVASCGLAIGLAFQGALSNLAGGFLILIFRPFKVGDYIEATGTEGVVKGMNIFYTRLATLDNRIVFVPNGDLMGSNVTNLTYEDVRRVDQSFKITNDIDQELVKTVLTEAVTGTPGVLEEPVPFVRLTEVADDTYTFTIRAWCKTPDYWPTYYDLIERCSKALSDNGIDDPEERIAVRIVNEENKEQE